MASERTLIQNATRLKPAAASSGQGAAEQLTYNWAGYSISKKRFTEVSARWRVPTLKRPPGKPGLLTCHTAVLVGGNDDDETFISIGILTLLDAADNITCLAYYNVGGTASVLPTAFPVQPGDQIAARLSCPAGSLPYTNQTWTLRLANPARRWVYENTQIYKSSLLSASWLVIASPEEDGSYALPNFGEITFTDVAANFGNPLLVLSRDGVVMIDETGKRIACPSYSSTGDSFTVGYGNKAPKPPSPYRVRVFKDLQTMEDINDGVVAAGWRDGGSGGRIVGFRYDIELASSEPIVYPGCTLIFCRGMNNHGHVVGHAECPRRTVGFWWDGASFHDLPDFEGRTFYPQGINDAGIIVGTCSGTGGILKSGFIFDGGTYRIVDGPPPHDGLTELLDVNNSGVVVGCCGKPGNVRGFSMDGSTFTPIAFPGADVTVPRGINDSGVIVGSMAGSAGFVLDGDGYRVLNPPGSTSTYIFGVNNHNHVVGYFSPSPPEQMKRYAFLAYLP